MWNHRFSPLTYPLLGQTLYPVGFRRALARTLRPTHTATDGGTLARASPYEKMTSRYYCNYLASAYRSCFETPRGRSHYCCSYSSSLRFDCSIRLG